MELEEFETVQRWLNGVRASQTGSDVTEKNYLRWFNEFCEWTGKNPDQLIAERKGELKSDDEAVRRKAEERLQRFCNYLEKERPRKDKNGKGLSRITVNAYHGAVRSFYSYNYVELKMKTPKAVSGGGVKPHTIEEIQKLLAYANPREKAAVFLAAETGMSREDICERTYGDIKREFEAGKRFIHMDVTREKEQVRHGAFIGPNAVETLKIYLEMRQRVDNETLTENTPLLKSEAFLEPTKLSPEGLSQLFGRLGDKAGMKTSPHRFRKFFESNMGLRAPSLLVKYWMGHSIGVEKSYFIPHVEEQRLEYVQAYEKIDVYKKQAAATLEDQKRLAYQLVKAAGLPADLLIKREKAKRPLTDREELEILMKALEKSRRTETNGNGPVDCQRIVAQEQLEEWLAKGWRFIAVLDGGKCIVEKDN